MLNSLVFIAILAPSSWWSEAVDVSLNRAPEHKTAWVAMLEKIPSGQRKGAEFLVRYIPESDLQSYPPASIAENVKLAYEARAAVPWGKRLPEEIFLESVLPHAKITEQRDPWRKEFMDRYLPRAKTYKTPGEAALFLNKTIFTGYKVTYNTRRLRTDQSPKQTISQGMATCTGLSIMLVDACRAVGVPARVAGIASWPGRGGNHTWVEVWDNGWHYVGAAEPDDKGLNHAWFTGDAATAIKSKAENAVWAVTYAPTGQHFPAVWAPNAKVPAENVTDRYTGAAAPKGPRLMVEVKKAGERQEIPVTMIDADTGKVLLEGTSLGPTADINLHLNTQVSAGSVVWIVATADSGVRVKKTSVTRDTVLRIDLSTEPTAAELADVSRLFGDRFSSDDTKRAQSAMVLASFPWNEELGRQAWESYKLSLVHVGLRSELAEKRVETANRKAPYLWRKVGDKPAGGWGLVIAMHGGGGTTQEFNDQQWRGMFERYYKDHPESGGYIYLALRAPNNEWNGFYDDAIGPMVERLIKQFVIAEDVDPDRVYTLGASHGGYGAFVIGPKIPYRFAAVHASASAQTDGETKGENLRNVRFSYMIGENDTAYGRAEKCQAFAKLLASWKEQYGGFDYAFEWLPGVGHSVPDRDKVAEMRAYQRNAWPTNIIWKQSDSILKNFYWIESLSPAENGSVIATVKDNVVSIQDLGQGELAVWLKDGFVDFKKPVVIVRSEERMEVKLEPSLETYARGLEERGDPILAAPIRIVVGK